MARPRQPLEVVLANGKKHLTKDEIAERRASEVKPIIDGVAPPDYLTKKQKEEFTEIADQLQKLKIMGETDIDALARFILSRDMYVRLSKKMRTRAVLSDPDTLDKYSKIHDRYFKQCRASATDLGLTISSRCKLVVPKVEEPKPNKFNKFKKVVG